MTSSADGLKYGLFSSDIYRGPLNPNVPRPVIPAGFAELSSSFFTATSAEFRTNHPNFDSNAWMDKDSPDPTAKGALHGFYARTYVNPATHEAVITFEGSVEPTYLSYSKSGENVPPELVTQAEGQWFDQNLANGTTELAPELYPAYHYSKFIIDQLTAQGYTDIRFTGHSLGGGLSSAIDVLFKVPAHGCVANPRFCRTVASDSGMIFLPKSPCNEFVSVPLSPRAGSNLLLH